MQADAIALREEAAETVAAHLGVTTDRVRPCLVPVMRGGQLTGALPNLETIRERFRGELARLPAPYKQLKHPPSFPVRLSTELQRQQAAATAAARAQLLK